MVCVQRKKLSVYERNKVPFISIHLVRLFDTKEMPLLIIVAGLDPHSIIRIKL